MTSQMQGDLWQDVKVGGILSGYRYQQTSGIALVMIRSMADNALNFLHQTALISTVQSSVNSSDI
jgi:hypothetical protein